MSECSSSDVDCEERAAPADGETIPDSNTTPDGGEVTPDGGEVDLNVLCSGMIEEYQAIILAANTQKSEGQAQALEVAGMYATIVSSTIISGRPALNAQNVLDTIAAEIANPANNYVRETFFRVAEV